jgi:amino acid transporter
MDKLKIFFLGKPKDPLASNTHKRLALTIFLAWVGLGADGLSSACYGPEQAFLALREHPGLALWLALATALTVFIIAFAYNRVITLFPNGGGGYKVATRLLGKYAGLVAGIALILDYILTVVISVASGMEAIFSIFGFHSPGVAQLCDAVIIMFITYLNMRGAKESIKFLLPIFIGFVIFHVALIVYGIGSHGMDFKSVVTTSTVETTSLFKQIGGLFITIAFLHAYAQGGGTYTGLEAVSNNVNILAEPRVKTGKGAMLWMAISLSFTAGGIILLYLLWQVSPQEGKTLNAVVFEKIMGDSFFGHSVVVMTLLFEAGLLFTAANTGFLGGPAVLANMGVDQWIPKIFVNVSDRLVRQNGILLFSAAALFILFITNAQVLTLVIIYSLSVFLAFSIAIVGLFKYYWTETTFSLKKIINLLLLGLGAIICISIFITVAITSFLQGSWIALFLISLLLVICLFIKRTYRITELMIEQLDESLCLTVDKPVTQCLVPDPKQPTAVIFVGASRGAAMHALLTIKRTFKDYYKNYVFVDVGVIDSFSMIGQNKIKQLKRSIHGDLDYLVEFCQSHNIPAMSRFDLTIDPVVKIGQVAKDLAKHFDNVAFFSSQLIFPGNNWVQKIIYNKTVSALQYEIYSLGYNMMILPVKVKIDMAKI